MNDDSTHTLAVLTLRRHKDGVWIQRLVEALQQHGPRKDTLHTEVVVLEDFLAKPFIASTCNDDNDNKIDTSHLYAAFARWTGIINRVSDAAEPWEVKATMALLQLAKNVSQIPVWNGPDAYSLCTHKWCHHVLFHRAGLSTPDTVARLQVSNDDEDDGRQQQECVDMLVGMQSSDVDRMDYLIKPNAGGFGAGIEKRISRRNVTMENANDNVDSSTQESSIPIPEYTDFFVLYQTYVPPQHNKIYRVWFLRGKVQCAVERTVDRNDALSSSTQQSTAEFTSGCAGGVCQLGSKPKKKPTPNLLPWAVSDDVRREIEDCLLPVLPEDAHCGSVEFLYAPKGVDNDDTTTGSVPSKRLYFDLNLLSTLPADPQSVASYQPDPWQQLADAIVEVLLAPRPLKRDVHG